MGVQKNEVCISEFSCKRVFYRPDYSFKLAKVVPFTFSKKKFLNVKTNALVELGLKRR